MSLEDALNANTKAVLAHNALLEKMLAGAGGKPATAPAAAAKPAAAAAAKPAAAAVAKPGAKPTQKKAETTSEHVSEKVKAYLKGGDEDERAARKAHVKAIIDYYGADRFTAIDPSKFDEALDFLSQFEAGGDPFADGEEAGEEGSEDDDGVV
jgi:hypothetical protein